MRNRREEIKAKGFNIVQQRDEDITDYRKSTGGYSGMPNPALDYGKIRVGAKTLDDAILDLGTYKKVNPRLADKEKVLRAIDNYDLKAMREISDFFYKTSGIYARAIRYLAYMYRYDWFVTPYVNDQSMKKEKILEGFNKTLYLLDNFEVKKILGEIARKVLIYGCYYGYKVKTSKGIVLQELPPNYCRVRFFYSDEKGSQRPGVEFNMKFFDDFFRTTQQRVATLKMFPPEFKKGYMMYKRGDLRPSDPGEEDGWYLLDPTMTVKFTMNGEDYPAFISAIPLIIDLDEAQALDRKRTLQRLLKIIIQKMPLDKNGDLIFDVEEARELHNNAVMMLGKAIGVDVLTTFADVDVEDLAGTNVANTQSDDLQRVERQVYNDMGIAQNQFNATGNLALSNSILNDASTMQSLVFQFEDFLNDLISDFNKNPKKLYFRVQILGTTIYNYQELSKLYKEHIQLGYSKMLPQIALGLSQSSILATAYFENDILDLVNVFIPPLMSSTMNENVLSQIKGGKGDAKAAPPKEENKAGRKEKSDDQKSDKTIQNRESMN